MVRGNNEGWEVDGWKVEGRGGRGVEEGGSEWER